MYCKDTSSGELQQLQPITRKQGVHSIEQRVYYALHSEISRTTFSRQPRGMSLQSVSNASKLTNMFPMEPSPRDSCPANLTLDRGLNGVMRMTLSCCILASSDDKLTEYVCASSSLLEYPPVIRIDLDRLLHTCNLINGHSKT